MTETYLVLVTKLGRIKKVYIPNDEFSKKIKLDKDDEIISSEYFTEERGGDCGR